MLKGLAIFTVILVVAQAPVATPRKGEDQRQSSKSDQSAASPTIQPAKPLEDPAIAAGREDDCEKKGGPANQQLCYWKQAFGPAYAANWALVLIGLVAGIMAWLTLRPIADQARFGRIAADAAKLNAEAVVNAERAWIRVLPHVWSPTLFPVWEQGDPIPPEGIKLVLHNFPAQIKNVGNTPAIVDETAFKYILSKVEPSQLPPEPDYGEFVPGNGDIIVSGNEWLADVGLSDGGALSKEQVKDIRTSKLWLYVYGIVRYRDVLRGDSHETRVGYVYHFPQGGMVNVEKDAFRPGGPPAYNRTT